MTREQQIQDHAKRTTPPSQRNPRTLNIQRIQAERVLDNPVAWGMPFVFVGATGND